MTKKEEIIKLLKAKIGRLLQCENNLESKPEDFLNSCCIYFRYCDERIAESTVQEVLFQAGEECKTLIDNLINNSSETFKSLNYKPDIPELIKIQCPECHEFSKITGEYEVGSVIIGIALSSERCEPIDQDIYDDDSDVRSPEYYCSYCGAMFNEAEILKMVDEYEMRYEKKVESDIDIFDHCWKKD